MAIMTVCGPIDAADAGVTLSHEHLQIDLWPIVRSYDCILDDEELAIEEVRAYVAAGGRTIVDATSGGLGRNPEALRRIAERTRTNIVMGASWYREDVYPRFVFENSTNALADRVVEELTIGVDGTRIRAGIIGEIGTERKHITPAQERVFRASARAQRRTGVSIITHTTHFGELALEQIALLSEEGVSKDRIIISHLGDRPDSSLMLKIAMTGVYMSVDNIGYTGSGYPGDAVRARNVKLLIAEGFLSSVLLGGDICMKSHLRAYGGKGYDHVSREFLPLLRTNGVSEEQIHAMTVANPARALDVTPPSQSAREEHEMIRDAR
jgi:phosphotriesterase-related protein